MKRITKWEEIAVHGSRYIAQFEDRLYKLHEDIRYEATEPGPCTVVLCELKPTLEESQQVVIDNINSDFQLDKMRFTPPPNVE
ncbi:MAG: hypothetical protein LV480_10635 [Methylacidiphilales bacterium]|nr:hypothetical protein [Candidatus Methylacidiphilales bacterium]